MKTILFFLCVGQGAFGLQGVVAQLRSQATPKPPVVVYVVGETKTCRVEGPVGQDVCFQNVGLLQHCGTKSTAIECMLLARWVDGKFVLREVRLRDTLVTGKGDGFVDIRDCDVWWLQKKGDKSPLPELRDIAAMLIESMRGNLPEEMRKRVWALLERESVGENSEFSLRALRLKARFHDAPAERRMAIAAIGRADKLSQEDVAVLIECVGSPIDAIALEAVVAIANLPLRDPMAEAAMVERLPLASGALRKALDRALTPAK